MNFLGIDLGWQSGPTGLCHLQLQGGQLMLVDLDRQPTHAAVLAWIDRQIPASEPVIAAVDAPTIIPNDTGMRLPDRLAHRLYGRYDAGCYPANRGRPFAAPLIAFGQALEQRGLVHAPNLSQQQASRYQIEVFPHPAMIRLFRLPRILKYKKGRLVERRPELARLRQLILTELPQLTPGLSIQPAELPAVPMTGAAMKALEDRLDSVICAYVAAHYWWWGLARNQVLGNQAEGYIVVPCPHGQPTTVGAPAEPEGAKS
ncbi:MAG: DUF429 domain-containing protein [Cyanobacteria bacterium J06554_6]